MGLFSSIFRKRNKVKNPDGSKTVTITDRHGNVRKTKHRDASGYKTKQFYDREGNLTKRKAKGPGMRRYKAKRRNFQNVTNAEFQPGRPWPGGAHTRYDQRNQTPITRQTSNGRVNVNATNNMPVPPPPIPGMSGNPTSNVVYNPNSDAYVNQNVATDTTINTNTPPPPPPPPANNGLSPFEQAFKTARSEQGPGGQFEFEGKQYNTNYKEEVDGARYGGRRPMVKALGGRIVRRRGGALGRNGVL